MNSQCCFAELLHFDNQLGLCSACKEWSEAVGPNGLLLNKNTKEALELLTRAATLLHDTGVIDSERLDRAVGHAQEAIDAVVYFRENELGDHL